MKGFMLFVQYNMIRKSILDFRPIFPDLDEFVNAAGH